MVLLAAVMTTGQMMGTIGEIAESNPHVVVDWTRDGDRYQDTEDDMHCGQGVEVAILQED
jgi:hypothetical protein